MKVKSAYPKRPGFFHHRTHWESRARDKKLDQETIKQIFRELYGEVPEEAVTKFQEEHIAGTEEAIEEAKRNFVYPFVFDAETRKQVKQIVRRVVQERGSQVVSETTGQ